MGVAVPAGGQVTANPVGTIMAPTLAPNAQRPQSVGVGVTTTTQGPMPPIYRRPIDPAQITAQPVPMPRWASAMGSN